jgi:DNA polymerase I-like protein with 3'-5' exonuclease and polymerase domains
MAFEYKVIYTAEALQEYVDSMNLDAPLYTDTETKGLRRNALLLCSSFYQAHILPAAVINKTQYWDGVSIEDQRRILNPVYKRAKAVYHNAKYDCGVLEVNGFVVPEVIYDTLSAIHLNDNTDGHNLEDHVYMNYKVKKKHFDTDIIGATWKTILKNEDNWQRYVHGKKEGMFVVQPAMYEGLSFVEALAKYACEDVFWLKPIHENISKSIHEKGFDNLFNKIEMPLIPVLTDMYRVGIGVDTEFIHGLATKCRHDMKVIEQEVYELAGSVFNLGSPQQVGKVLFQQMKLPIVSRTAGGAPQVNAKSLKKLAAKGFPIAKKLQEYSAMDTMLTGFLVSIPLLVDPDGRLRAGFNATGTDTRRFSSSSPNLQNQPNSEVYPIRQAYKARPGYKLVGLDYSQIEYRLLAHISRDPKLIAAFCSGRDFHGEVAKALGIQRKHAKTVNFGIIYGMGAASLAETLGISKDEAQAMLWGYEQQFNVVPKWKTHVEDCAKRDGFVKNIFGAVRYLPNVRSQNDHLYFGALRQAVNTVIQGSAADMIKLAMIRAYQYIKDTQLDAALLLQVHDELIFECREDQAQQLWYNVREIMEGVIPNCRVPVIAEGKIMDNWFQMKDDSFHGYQIDPRESNFTNFLLTTGLLN